ncbi:hypothetical protein M8J76_009528 [Diaphorina citri]|nr:hypothetical protein M8J75_005728 [Diaphorina citri]KAI5726847.1 hypothetical protein M8J76_009528 [Diaphorina citri]KAI5731033.1 hypothetical protein M8J77_003635 [Diaphorina citri]
MYSHLCSCMKTNTFNSKSAFFLFNRTGLCCNQRYSSGQDHTHYEILELERNCSPKEIRSAFIRLSKQFHPDKNPSNPALHDKFVKLNEAYSILNDMDRRRNYDASLNLQTVRQNMFVHKTRARSSYSDSGERPENWKDYYDFAAQLKRNESIHVPKFLHKFEKLSKAALVMLLIGVATGALGLQILAVQYSKTFPRNVVNSREMEISQNLMNARNDAKKYDLQENIDRFAKRYQESYPYRRPDS